MFVGVDADVTAVFKPAIPGVAGKITGPWLWMIAATEAGQAGQTLPISIRSLKLVAVLLPEEMVAMNGASEGGRCG